MLPLFLGYIYGELLAEYLCACHGHIRVVRTFENHIPGFPGGKWMIPGVKLKKGCQIPGVFYAGFPVGHCVVYNSNAMMG